MYYERIIEQEELGMVDGLELLLMHYRFGLNGEQGCILCDKDGNVCATINLKKMKSSNLVVRTGGYWGNEHYYKLSGDFLSPIIKEKINKKINIVNYNEDE